MPAKQSILDYLAHHARSSPARTVVHYRDRELSFRELEERAARCRGALAALGVAHGDRVALVMSDSPEMIIAMLGAMSHGAIVVPCSTMLKPAELEYILTDCSAKLVIATPEHADNARAAKAPRVLVAPDEFNALLDKAQPAPPGRFDRDTPCLILYTSGSTGSPKGAVHLHDHFSETIERVARQVYALRPDDRLFSSSRLFFAYGLGNSFSFPIGMGSQVVLCSERPTPQVIADIFKRYRPSIFFAVPAVYRGLIEYARQGNKLETAALRFCVSAGEVLPVATWHEWKELAGAPILEGLGTTELLHCFIHNFPDRYRPGSSGLPLDGYDVHLVDEHGSVVQGAAHGRLQVKGRSAIPYYLNKPDKTAELIRDGWVTTGDVYRRDEDGFYWFEGRSDDLFKCSGMWVSPGEVEEAVIAHPAVLEAAVVAETDDKGATIAAAYVALRPGNEAGDALANEIKEHAAKNLPRFKRPQRIHFMDALPRTATGKVQRFKLRQLSAANRGQSPI
ncbi:MAG TPA: benzoate-CoA ligase family protein [Burkholderiales bacterium]|nr:benzoate-CoA ligase family protein [Burkholderiales bacterium]